MEIFIGQCSQSRNKMKIYVERGDGILAYDFEKWSVAASVPKRAGVLQIYPEVKATHHRVEKARKRWLDTFTAEFCDGETEGRFKPSLIQFIKNDIPPSVSQVEQIIKNRKEKETNVLPAKERVGNTPKKEEVREFKPREFKPVAITTDLVKASKDSLICAATSKGYLTKTVTSIIRKGTVCSLAEAKTVENHLLSVGWLKKTNSGSMYIVHLRAPVVTKKPVKKAIQVEPLKVEPVAPVIEDLNLEDIPEVSVKPDPVSPKDFYKEFSIAIGDATSKTVDKSEVGTGTANFLRRIKASLTASLNEIEAKQAKIRGELAVARNEAIILAEVLDAADQALAKIREE